MKRKQPIRFVLDCDLYCANIYVSVGGSAKDAVKWWHQKIGFKGPIDATDDHERRVGTVFSVEGNMGCLIWLWSPSIGVGTLSHECFHATCRILDHTGMRCVNENEEAYAYLLTWISREVALKIWHRRKK